MTEQDFKIRQESRDKGGKKTVDKNIIHANYSFRAFKVLSCKEMSDCSCGANFWWFHCCGVQSLKAVSTLRSSEGKKKKKFKPVSYRKTPLFENIWLSEFHPNWNSNISRSRSWIKGREPRRKKKREAQQFRQTASNTFGIESTRETANMKSCRIQGGEVLSSCLASNENTCQRL